MGAATGARPGRHRPDSARGRARPSSCRGRVRALGRGIRRGPAGRRPALRVRQDVRPGRDADGGGGASPVAGDREPDPGPVDRLRGRRGGGGMDGLLRDTGPGGDRCRGALAAAFTCRRHRRGGRHCRCRSYPCAVAVLRPGPVRARGRRLLGSAAQPDHDRRHARAAVPGPAHRFGAAVGALARCPAVHGRGRRLRGAGRGGRGLAAPAG